MVGCGNLNRPVVTSIPPVQPAAQPNKYAVVVSCGSTPNVAALTIDQVCAGSTVPGSTVPGLASLVDFSGDSLMARVNLGKGGPRWVALSSNGATAYIVNADGTINSFVAQTSPQIPLETSSVNTSTLLPGAGPNTLLFTNNYLYVSQPARNSISVLNASTSGAPAAFLEIPNIQNPVNLVGNPSAQRIYAISQGLNNGSCPASGPNGTVISVEILTNTPSAILQVGACPIYGVMSSDDRRTFILNEGGNTITVIDSQQNRIDPNFPNGIIVGDGPVWADIYNNGSLLAVANSRSGTLTLINISQDSFGNDSPNFGQIIATVPVGVNPASVSILQDGTRAYVANRNDPTNTSDPSKNGSVSVVNLTTSTVTKTIPLTQQPCAGNPTTLCNVHPISIAATTGTPTGKVYVVSPDTNILTIIRTNGDGNCNVGACNSGAASVTSYEELPLSGNGVQVRVTAP
jgi:DNA-binding beta-propeller fold protein YncE